MYYWLSCPDEDIDYIAEYRCNWLVWNLLINCLDEKVPRVTDWCETYKEQKMAYDLCIERIKNKI